MSEAQGSPDRDERHETRAAERAARHATRAAARSERHEARTADRAARHDDLPPGYAALWRPEPPAAGRRGPRPGLTVAEIVDAAVGLADREGSGAVSMARVADEVGVTTMALYRYLGGKDELVAAMYDAAVGLPPAQDPGTPWRPALEAWCRAQLARAVRHPWLGAVVPPAAIGPNRLAWIEAGLCAVAGTPLAPAQRAAVVGRLSLHLLGEMQLIAAMAPRAHGEPVEHPATLDYRTVLARFADPATHPATVAALEAGAFDEDPAEDMRDFGLELLLDGVAALVGRASAD
jgi:AcrR family transcriptional regulator